ncbi:SulP family inorganic anion transporter [Azomonas macrocytogenes]|uniref:SulP family inorganic anion transporter n=1 Tax=Azomonas macrocytogenes TaxID=69962 RepID=UPI001605F8B6
MLETIKQQWFSNLPADLLSGLVVALALIPEAITFSIMAGVDPKVGLYASFCIAVTIAFAGGRPAMISAATAAMAILMSPLVKDYGLQYLLAASLLCGVLQIIGGFLHLGSLMRFISRSVVTGFANALAILIFMAQLPELTGVTWHVHAMTVAGLGIIYLFPHIPVIGKVIPSPLICIFLLTAASMTLHLGEIRTVGDMGKLPNAPPIFIWPDVPLTLETLKIILPYSCALAAVGLLESLMSAAVVEELTDIASNRNRECKGQGLANIVSSLFGGMAGCGMIGQSIVNVKSGGRTRLSTLTAGIMLLVLVIFFSDWVRQIPMAALVSVMIMVSIGTFGWDSLRNFRRYPCSSNVVMLATVITVLVTHNLAYGVLTGVLLAAIFFANKVSHYLHIHSEPNVTENERTYRVVGQVFFGSSEKFVNAFDFNEALAKVNINLSKAHFWDISAVAALDKTIIKFRREGATVEIQGMNELTATIVHKHGAHIRLDATDEITGR